MDLFTRTPRRSTLQIRHRHLDVANRVDATSPWIFSSEWSPVDTDRFHATLPSPSFHRHRRPPLLAPSALYREKALEGHMASTKHLG
ncbi:hypothetical protein ACS0TY_027266 [Phlomoides rotata]